MRIYLREAVCVHASLLPSTTVKIKMLQFYVAFLYPIFKPPNGYEKTHDFYVACKGNITALTEQRWAVEEGGRVERDG